MSQLLVTVAVAIGTAVMQLVMKGSSRTNRINNKHGLTRDDALFWSDWTIAAALALAGTLLLAARENEPVPVKQVVLAFSAIFFGCSFFPLFLRTFAYDDDAKLKAGMRWIVVANLGGLLPLLAAVAAGVSIYE